MRDDKIVLLIVTFLMGGMLAGFGLIIKTQNAGDMINGFDDKKDDKEKVSKIMGKSLLSIGMSVIVVGLLGVILLNDYLKYIAIIQTAIVIVGVVIGCYKTNKYGKKDINKNE